MKPTEMPRVVVVGGGFAGSLTAAHLLRNAAIPIDVCLIERRPPFGAGTAFATPLPCHLLNVPANKMSAYAGDPEHLLRWLSGRGPDSGRAYASPVAFLPRRLYGEYVEHTLLQAAERSSARFTRMVGEVVSIGPETAAGTARLRLRDGATLAASRVVLAIGIQPPADPLEGSGLRSSRRYAPDPWDAGALDPLAPEDTVLAIGSNLTMVDVALTLEYRSHRGPIIAISTHGLLPLPQPSELLPTWTSRVDGTVSGPRALLRALREDARVASAQGVEWRPVVDSIRSRTGAIWASWRESERRRFLRHARPYWDVHRHRMAPENAKSIAALLETGRLRVVAGRIAGASERGDAVEIQVTRRGKARPEIFRAARVVNCTGPGMDYRLSRDVLIQDLLARGLARPGPLGLGFDADRDGALIGSDGRPSSMLFTLGPPLKGRYWETLAVPEIREQAETLARKVAEGAKVKPGAHGRGV